MSNDQDQAMPLCQACGEKNPIDATHCTSCGAMMPAYAQKLEEEQEKQKMMDSMPELLRNKITDLEKQLEERPDAVALHIQLSGLYKDAKITDFAIKHMEKAVELDPGNKFLKQKLRMLIDPAGADQAAIQRLTVEKQTTKKQSRIALLVIGGVVLLIALYFLYGVLFPGAFRLAKKDKENDMISPLFNSDGTKIAYLRAPKFSIGAVIEAFEGTPRGETWIMVKPLKGEPIEVTKLTAGRSYYSDFAWRPKHDELTFTSWSYQRESEESEPGSQIYLVSASGGAPKKIAQGHDFAWSRDGKYLAYVKLGWGYDEPRGLFVLNMDSGANTHVSELSCSHPKWSPTEDTLIFEGKDWNRYRSELFDIGGGNSSKSKLSSYIGDVYSYDAGTGRVAQITTEGQFRSPTFTPDGEKIVALTYADADETENELHIMNKDGSERFPLLSPSEQYNYFDHYSFSPDGKTLAFEGYFPSPNQPEPSQSASPLGAMAPSTFYVSDIFLVNSDGSDLRRLESKKHKFKARPEFSPDGSLLAYEVMYVDMGRDIWAMKMK